MGNVGQQMCEGEFESLKAIYATCPDFVPEPFAWGKYKQEGPESYFLFTAFRDIGKQVGWLLSSPLQVSLPHNRCLISRFIFCSLAHSSTYPTPE